MNNSAEEPETRIRHLSATNADRGPSTPTAEMTGPDAAEFAAASPPHSRLGLFCHADQLYFLSVPSDDDELALLPISLVGDPYADRIHVVRGIDFWVGDRSLQNHPPNTIASILLDDLLGDILTGEVAADEDDLTFVRRLRVTGVPRVAGPCLLLGRDETTDTSTGLPETFLDWLRRKAAQPVVDPAEKLTAGDGADLDK
ncbi:hypothetical protein [Saccharothrix stipae]